MNETILDFLTEHSGKLGGLLPLLLFYMAFAFVTFVLRRRRRNAASRPPAPETICDKIVANMAHNPDAWTLNGTRIHRTLPGGPSIRISIEKKVELFEPIHLVFSRSEAKRLRAAIHALTASVIPATPPALMAEMPLRASTRVSI